MNIIELNLEETLAVVGGASASTAVANVVGLTAPINETSLKAALAQEKATLISALATPTFSPAAANASA